MHEHNVKLVPFVVVLAVAAMAMPKAGFASDVSQGSAMPNNALAQQSSANGSMNANGLGAQRLTYEEFIRVIEHGDADQINLTLNEMGNIGYDVKFIQVARELYLKKKNLYPKANWHEIEQPKVRVQLANALLMAQRNQIIKMDIGPIHEELRALAQSPDLSLVVDALPVLALVDDDKDIDLISAIVLQEDPKTFYAATGALTMMCSSRIPEVLNKLASNVKKPGSVTILKKSMANLKDIRDMGWCLAQH